jgi:hypothetical protein
MKKKTYAQPQLTVHGNVAALTQATRTGLNLDGDFVAGTPLSEVTVS